MSAREGNFVEVVRLRRADATRRKRNAPAAVPAATTADTRSSGTTPVGDNHGAATVERRRLGRSDAAVGTGLVRDHVVEPVEGRHVGHEFAFDVPNAKRRGVATLLEAGRTARS